eukprot:GHVU01126010.1.p2 GENE.GHVU01126010.1~~GHVU01126010.1.p2  ORF type:complete len:117 (+),score=15.71 GHVU01126010.1:699-1049(+)
MPVDDRLRTIEQRRRPAYVDAYVRTYMYVGGQPADCAVSVAGRFTHVVAQPTGGGGGGGTDRHSPAREREETATQTGRQAATATHTLVDTLELDRAKRRRSRRMRSWLSLRVVGDY